MLIEIALPQWIFFFSLETIQKLVVKSDNHMAFTPV